MQELEENEGPAIEQVKKGFELPPCSPHGAGVLSGFLRTETPYASEETRQAGFRLAASVASARSPPPSAPMLSSPGYGYGYSSPPSATASMRATMNISNELSALRTAIDAAKARRATRWTLYYGPDNIPYYYCQETGESRWTLDE